MMAAAPSVNIIFMKKLSETINGLMRMNLKIPGRIIWVLTAITSTVTSEFHMFLL